MAKATYVIRNGRLVLKERALPIQRDAGPMVISDDLGQQLEHHGYSDGRRTDSKSVFRNWTKQAGLVEKGNDRIKSDRRLGSPTNDVVRDVAQAVNMLKNGYVPQIRWREDQ